MCFSATASFGAGIVLTGAGVITRLKIISPAQKPFAAIPFLFAIQQFMEGFVWLSLTNPNFATWHLPATYVFLIFAQVVWPVWVPFSILKLEPKENPKKILRVFFYLGTLVSIYLAYCLFAYPVQSDIADYHIRYTLSFPVIMIPASGLLYFIPITISPFVSSVKRMNFLGFAILGSYIVTILYYQEHVISVWCFLAAILSVLVFSVLSSQKMVHYPLVKITL